MTFILLLCFPSCYCIGGFFYARLSSYLCRRCCHLCSSDNPSVQVNLRWLGYSFSVLYYEFGPTLLYCIKRTTVSPILGKQVGSSPWSGVDLLLYCHRLYWQLSPLSLLFKLLSGHCYSMPIWDLTTTIPTISSIS